MIVSKCATNLTFVNAGTEPVFLRSQSVPRRFLSTLQTHLAKSCNLQFSGQSVRREGMKEKKREGTARAQPSHRSAGRCGQLLQPLLPHVPHLPHLWLLVGSRNFSGSPGHRGKVGPKLHSFLEEELFTNEPSSCSEFQIALQWLKKVHRTELIICIKNMGN